MSYGIVTIGTGSNLIVDANPSRNSLIIFNNSSQTVYIGQDSSVTTASGIAIVSYGNLTEDSGGHKVYCGPIYGISTASSDVRYWERVR